MSEAPANPLPIPRAIAWTIFATRLAILDPLEILRARSINDYGSFHAAAYAITEGLDPYRAEDLRAAASLAGLGGVHPYFYPPFLAEVIAPLTWLSPFAARVVWLFASALAFFASMALLDRFLARSIDDPSRADAARTAFAVAMCAAWPIRSTQWMGQVNGFVLLLLVVWWTQRARTPRAGIALGVAAAVKMSPLLLVLVPLSYRRARREALWAIATAAGLVIGSSALLGARGARFLQQVLLGFLPGRAWHGLSVPIDIAGNHSLAALGFWLFDRRSATDHLRLSSTAATFQIASLAVLLATWALAVIRRASAERRASMLVVVMILAPTYAFEHHVAFATLPIALTILLWARGELGRGARVAAAIALALLTIHEGDLLPPPTRLPVILVALGHASKLAPLLALFAIAAGATPRHAASTARIAPVAT